MVVNVAKFADDFDWSSAAGSLEADCRLKTLNHFHESNACRTAALHDAGQLACPVGNN